VELPAAMRIAHDGQVDRFAAEPAANRSPLGVPGAVAADPVVELGDATVFIAKRRSAIDLPVLAVAIQTAHIMTGGAEPAPEHECDGLHTPMMAPGTGDAQVWIASAPSCSVQERPEQVEIGRAGRASSMRQTTIRAVTSAPPRSHTRAARYLL